MGRLRNHNVLRHIRLQLKTGYMKEPPPEYEFMKKYPALSRDTQERFHKPQVRKIPYYDLYMSAVQKNPLYNDERVYGAYWQQEPQALTLAKKQYQYMQQEQLNEEDAYQRAVAHVDELENVAYEGLQAMHLALEEEGGTVMPYMADANLADELEHWRSVLAEEAYEALSLEEQGHIDFLLQTKILKWNEVERERRMKDPVFVMAFVDLRKTIFPRGEELVGRQRDVLRKAVKDRYFLVKDMDSKKVRAKEPFFLEDYLHFLELCIAEPNLKGWEAEDKLVFSKWIVDTLAFVEILERGEPRMVQRYLDDIRAQFFPMIRAPERAGEFRVNFKEVRALLYHNGVGYKRAGPENKLFVHRFYTIPNLLHPKEMLTQKLLADEDFRRKVMTEDGALMAEIRSAGLDESVLPWIKDQMNELLSDSNLDVPDYSSLEDGDVQDLSMLDKIMDDAYLSSRDTPSSGMQEEILGTEEVEEEEEEGQVKRLEKEAWEKLVTKYRKNPVTTLELERDKIYRKVEYNAIEDAKTEEFLAAYKLERLQNEIIHQAKCAKTYETKEAARRAKSWKDEGKELQMPRPSLPMMKN